jgi:hypothetical protein
LHRKDLLLIGSLASPGEKTRGQQNVGDYVCKYGKVTGYGCGYIVSKSVLPCGGANTSYVGIKVDSDPNGTGYDLAEGGDSAGPFFYVHTALGTLSCQVGFDAVYIATDYVEYGLGGGSHPARAVREHPYRNSGYRRRRRKHPNLITNDPGRIRSWSAGFASIELYEIPLSNHDCTISIQNLQPSSIQASHVSIWPNNRAALCIRLLHKYELFSLIRDQLSSNQSGGACGGRPRTRGRRLCGKRDEFADERWAR